MKFRDPKTGEVFEDIKDAYSKFCCGHDCDTGCPLYTFKVCNNWSFNHPAEAARLMDYEMVEDSATGEAPDGRPRICEVLGGKDNPLEVGEVFTINGYPNRGYRYAIVHVDGKLHNYLEEPCQTTGTRVGNKIGVNAFYWLLDHPEAIIRKPRFTEEEVALLRSLCAAGARWLARGDKHLRWYARKPYQRVEDDKWDMRGNWGTMSGKLPAKLFPSIRTGQSVALEDIVRAG